MAKIYKKIFNKIDPATGQKVKKESKKWWGRYIDAIGIERFTPLALNKKTAQQMLNDILEKVEAEKAGLIDPTEVEMRKPIEIHLADFETHLKTKNSEPRYVVELVGKVRRCAEHCKWLKIGQIKTSDVEGFLFALRDQHNLSIRTSNHYLKAIKQFCRWLVLNQRMKQNPVERIAALNARTDRRHDRRALSMDELLLLIQAAETGPPAVGLVGPDRAMLYLLAAWTGFRRGELGSLTLRSFIGLDTDHPTIKVEAAYSKHRRDDVQLLHPEIAERFKKWIAGKKPKSDEILFPVSLKTCGIDRRTSEMMAFDLKSARQAWLAEVNTPTQFKERSATYFLCYKDEHGRFADFHALRHTFITNLCRANVSPKVAQTLARHSDVRLTLEIYSHAETSEQVAAINALPGLGGKKK